MVLLFMNRLLFLLFFAVFQANEPAPRDYCIIKDTYGTYSKFDLDKLISYSTDNEVTQIRKMLQDKKLVSLKKGTKVELVDSGFTKTVIRLPDDEKEDHIWILSDALGNCKDLK